MILHGSEGAYYGLNSTGTLLWQEMREPRSSGQLVSLVAERFQLEPKVVKSDVAGVLVQMLEAGLIEIVSEAPIT